MLRLVVDAGYDGVVLGGFGVGHVPESVAAVVSTATATMPVVLASRTGAGAVLSRTYGFVGSETDLLDRGAISAGWLDARKSRLLLGSLLALGADRDEIGAEFARRGDPEQPGA